MLNCIIRVIWWVVNARVFVSGVMFRLNNDQTINVSIDMIFHLYFLSLVSLQNTAWLSSKVALEITKGVYRLSTSCYI